MNKNVIAVFAAACGLFMVSCDTPKDLRPGEKVAADMVEPGMRSTFNVSDAGDDEATAHKGDHSETQVKEQEIMPNHDMGENTLQPGDTAKKEETNTEAGAVRK